MKRMLMLCALYGIDFRRGLRAVKNTPRYLRDLLAYRRAQKALPDNRFPIRYWELAPYILDYDDSARSVKGHYFHQDLWAARKIFAQRPKHHFDIGSRVDGFIAHLLVFTDVTVIDIRKLESNVKGLAFLQRDATYMEQFQDGSIRSLSSLHVGEHFGLGRYGDSIDPNACFDFMKGLQRVLASGGRLYYSVPIGEERLKFNSLRCFSPHTVLDTFDQLSLVSFAAVNDAGDFVADARPEDFTRARYSCGLFEFTKR